MRPAGSAIGRAGVIEASDETVVLIEGLRYHYPPFRSNAQPMVALRGIDLQVKRGELLAIMGPVGAGKSTLCLALAALVPHATGGHFGGRVVVNGRDTREAAPSEISCHLGLVFQDSESQLFNATVEDEVAFGPESLALERDAICRRVDWALDVVRLTDRRHSSPRHLSGGQKQRLAIAAVLAMRPAVLVLDEPTANLDPVGAREVFATIHTLRKSRDLTVILVEQDAERVAEFADRVVLMDQGRVVAEGSPSQVFDQKDLMEDLGLAAPPVSDLARLLQRDDPCFPNLTTLAEAEVVLRRRLSGTT